MNWIRLVLYVIVVGEGCGMLFVFVGGKLGYFDLISEI